LGLADFQNLICATSATETFLMSDSQI